MTVPRVAFFSDSFHEVNGVALTSRKFAEFARVSRYPFFCCHAGPETKHWVEGEYETFELAKSRFMLGVERDLAFDLAFPRHLRRVQRAVERFRPDLVHITGPNHCSLIGAIIAHRTGVPLVASWHTNVHEYAGRRLAKLLANLPSILRMRAAALAERKSLDVVARLYKRAMILFAPNPELISMLEGRTKRPVYLMPRGIDAAQFSPAWRDRTDQEFVIGYVGRLSTEKNVSTFVELERSLIEAGVSDYRFLIVGDGNERRWLSDHLQRKQLTGTLSGEALSRAYANMDVFVFPSTTDTFGNVILEAMASGVPPVVSAEGGPKYLVQPAITGNIATNARSFAQCVLELKTDSDLRLRMAQCAREAALRYSWKSVFEDVYGRYADAIASGLLLRASHSRRAGAKTLMITVP